MASIPVRRYVLAFLLVLVARTVAQGDTPCEQLLPASTKVFVSAPAFQQISSAFEASQFGRLWNSPELKPFVDQLLNNSSMIWNRAKEHTGTSLEELRQVAVGEGCLAIVELGEDRRATIFLVQVGDNEAAVRDLIAEAQERVRPRGARFSNPTIAGTTLHVFDIPDDDARTIYFLKGGVLGICSDLDLAKLSHEDHRWFVAYSTAGDRPSPSSVKEHVTVPPLSLVVLRSVPETQAV